MNKSSKEEEEIQELATRAAKGDSKALDELFKSKDFQRMVDIACRRVFRTHSSDSRVNLEDLRQEVYLRVLKNISQFRGTASLDNETPIDSWLAIIAKNTYLNNRRREIKEKEASRYNATLWEPKRSEGSQQFNAALREAFLNLSLQERLILDMYTEGFNAREIAEKLGISIVATYRKIKQTQQKITSYAELQGKSLTDVSALDEEAVEHQDFNLAVSRLASEIQEIRNRMQRVQLEIEKEKELTRTMLVELQLS